MRVVVLDGVGAAPPGIDVERAVVLVGPGVAVAQGGEILRRGLPVELAESHARVVGALDWPVLVGAAQGGEGGHDARLDAVGVGLLGGLFDVEVAGEEEEELVAHERAAERGADLVSGRIKRRSLRAIRALGPRRQAVAGVVVVARAVKVVGARLGDDVDEARGGAAVLGVGPVGHDHDFGHRVEIESERGALASALLAEERIIEVRAVHRDVVLNAFLAVDRELVAVGPLDGSDAGRQLGEIEEVVAVVGKVLDGPLVDARYPLDARGLDDRRFARDGHFLLDARELGLEREADRLADREIDAFAHEGRESLRRDRDAVGAGRQAQGAEAALAVGREGLFVVGRGVLDRHRGPA